MGEQRKTGEYKKTFNPKTISAEDCFRRVRQNLDYLLRNNFVDFCGYSEHKGRKHLCLDYFPFAGANKVQSSTVSFDNYSDTRTFSESHISLTGCISVISPCKNYDESQHKENLAAVKCILEGIIKDALTEVSHEDFVENVNPCYGWW